MANDKRSGRSRKSAVLYTPIAALLIIFLLIFGFSVFFRISAIDVNGAKKYTTEQVISASGIKTGDNLIFVDPYASAESIMTNLPYLNEVMIEKIVPDKVIINVTESQPMAVIWLEDTWWLLDQKARILEATNAEMADKKIEIIGIAPKTIIVGQKLMVDDKDNTRLLYLSNVLTAIESDGISADVGAVDVTNAGSITFTYLDRFTVILGNGEDIEYKLIRMHDVIKLSQLDPDEKGKIDVSKDGKSSFIPDDALNSKS